MDELLVRTDIHLPQEEVYAFLLDFEGYAAYSEYLDEVRVDGDGGAGTRYAIALSWWRINYTAHTEVTDATPPSRINWSARTRAIDARGFWKIEPLDQDQDHPTSRVTLVIRYDPDSADASVVKLPAFVSVSWVIDRVRPLLRREAERVVERIVADLEGEPRSIDLDIETRHT